MSGDNLFIGTGAYTSSEESEDDGKRYMRLLSERECERKCNVTSRLGALQ